MGMPISLDIPSRHAHDDSLTGHADAVFAWLRHVDEVFSTYKPDSEISRMRAGTVRTPSAEVAGVLDQCADLWRESDGYFDVYATGALDPSGYVKGWAIQVASDRLVAAGVRDHLLNAGGDIRASGVSGTGLPWRVGILHPFEQDRVAWVLGVSDRAVATSGTYARGEHVIDPHTGRKATALVSTTVVGADLGTADAYATAALAMGEAGVGWLARLEGYASAAITADGRAFRSDDLPTVDG